MGGLCTCWYMYLPPPRRSSCTAHSKYTTEFQGESPGKSRSQLPHNKSTNVFLHHTLCLQTRHSSILHRCNKWSCNCKTKEQVECFQPDNVHTKMTCIIMLCCIMGVLDEEGYLLSENNLPMFLLNAADVIKVKVALDDICSIQQSKHQQSHFPSSSW